MRKLGQQGVEQAPAKGRVIPRSGGETGVGWQAMVEQPGAGSVVAAAGKIHIKRSQFFQRPLADLSMERGSHGPVSEAQRVIEMLRRIGAGLG